MGGCTAYKKAEAPNTTLQQHDPKSKLGVQLWFLASLVWLINVSNWFEALTYKTLFGMDGYSIIIGGPAIKILVIAF